MSKGRELEYRADIDGLRAIAVMAVVLFHAFPRMLPGGFIGVDVFFVISGFLITQVISEQVHKRSFSIYDFYSRRIRRIFPALFVVLSACLVIGLFALFPDEYYALCKHVVAAAAFAANVQFWREAGYFDRLSDQKPLLHLWSLGIEEQFYMLWPILLIIFSKRRLGLVLLATLSFACCCCMTRSCPTFSFYMLPTRFWEMAAGGVAAAYSCDLSSSRYSNAEGLEYLKTGMSFAGITLLGIGIVFIDRTKPFPGVLAIIPVAGAALSILAGPMECVRVGTAHLS